LNARRLGYAIRHTTAENSGLPEIEKLMEWERHFARGKDTAILLRAGLKATSLGTTAIEFVAGSVVGRIRPNPYSLYPYNSGTKFCSWMGGLTYLVLSSGGSFRGSGVRSW
jgi:hypothetical protein